MSSNQRPDTLMQDRYCQLDENLLRRTAGPYIKSHSDPRPPEALPLRNSALEPGLRTLLDHCTFEFGDRL